MGLTGYARFFVKPATTTTTTTTPIKPTTPTTPSQPGASAITTLANNVSAARRNNVLGTIQSIHNNNARTGKTVNASGKYQDVTNWDRWARTSDQPTYDVDSALQDIYNQAKERGITIARPKKYGNSISDQRQAQKIIDEYLRAANSAISKNSSKGESVNTQRAGNTTSYDISQNLKDVQAQAKKYGVSVALPKTTQYKSQKEAQKALDIYVNQVNSKLTAQTNAQNATVAKPTAPVQAVSKYPNTPGVTDQDWFDGLTEKQKWDQIYLMQDYNKTQKDAGTTHAKNTKAVTNNGKSASQIMNDNKGVKQTVKAQVVKAGAVAPSVAAKAKVVKSQPIAVSKQAAQSKQTTQDLIRINSKIKQTMKASIIPANHEGQVQLKNGKWINQFEKGKGASNPNSGATKIYDAKLTASQLSLLESEYQQRFRTGKTGKSQSTYRNAAYDEAVEDGRKAQAEFNAVSKAHSQLLDKNFKAVNQITDKKGRATRAIGANGQQITITSNVKVNGEKKQYTRSGSQTSRDASNYNANRAKMGASAIGTKFTSKSAKFDDVIAFKTVTQKRNEEIAAADKARQDKIIARGGVGGLLVKLDQEFREAGNYNKVKKQAGHAFDKLDARVSPYIPTEDAIIQARKSTFDKIGGKGTTEKLDKTIASHKNLQAVSDWEAEKYDYVKTHPARIAAAAASMYAGGAVAGAVIGGGLSATSIGAGKIASKATSPIVKAGAGLISKHVVGAGNAVMGAGVVYSGAQTVKTGDVGKTLDFLGSLAIGGAGYKKGVGIAKDPISIIPGARNVKIQTMPEGASSLVKDLKIGETLTIGGRPLVSRGYDGKIIRGAPRVPEHIVKGNDIQAYDKVGVEAFNRSLDALTDAQTASMFRSGRNIASKVYKQSSPVTKPKEFVIASKDIPEAAKPAVAATIKKYPGMLGTHGYQVYGSATQKLQMEGYFSRTPKDLEISVSSLPRFMRLFEAEASKSGLKRTVDYNINTIVTESGFKTRAEAIIRMKALKKEDVLKIYPLKKVGDTYQFDYKAPYTPARGGNPKIEFKFGDKWEKGIEVFSHSSKIDPTTGYTGANGLRLEPDIAWGFKGKKSIKVDGVKMMGLPEQAARKLEGSAVLRNRDIVPKHEGREKDIRDLIEIGTAYELVSKLGLEQDIVNYARISSGKFKSVSESPVAQFIAEKGRLPTKAEIDILLKSGSLTKEEANIVLKNKLKSPSGPLNPSEPIGQGVGRSQRLFRKAAKGKTSVKPSNSVKEVAKARIKQPVQQRKHPKVKKFRGAKQSIHERELLLVSEKMSTRALRELKDTSKKLEELSKPRIGSKGAARSQSMSLKPSKPSKFTSKSVTPSRSKPANSNSKSKNLSGSRTIPSTPNRRRASGGIKPANSKQSTQSRKTPSRSVPSKSIPSKSIPSKSIPSKSVPSRSVPSKSVPSQSIPSKSVPSRSTPSRSTPSTSSYSPYPGSTSETSTAIFRQKKRRESIIADRKRKNQKIDVKKAKDLAKQKRTIFNKLGGLESMFGSSSKPAKKVTAKRKTTKRRA